jgi:tRNA (uracil-5-)-methyltransferase
MLAISDDNTPFTLTYMTYDPNTYKTQLDTKVEHALSLLTEESIPVLSIPHEIFESPAKNYRHRCRFGVDGDIDSLWYVMWEHGEANVRLTSFPLASIHISTAMPILIEHIKNNEVLRSHIKAVNFLSTTAGELSITMIYEGSFSAEWTSSSRDLFATLNQHESFMAQGTNLVGIIGRSKGVKCVVGREEVRERFHLITGRVLEYTQVPDGFSNPNPEVNTKCLNWLCDVINNIPALCRRNSGSSSDDSGMKGSSSEGGPAKSTEGDQEHCDLLELYCGNGNHTVALAGTHIYLLTLFL